MAIAVLDDIWELLDKESPGDMSISPAQTEATLFFVTDWNQNIYTTINDILGFTTFSNFDYGIDFTGGLSRTIPISHPLIPNLYAQEVKIVGIGPDGKWDSEKIEWNVIQFNTGNANAVEYKTNPTTGKYLKARLEVTFRAVNYMVFDDDQLRPLIYQGDVVPPSYDYYFKKIVNNAGTLEFQPQITGYVDFREYLRYTSMDFEPNNEIIVKQNGSLYYKSSATPEIIGARANNQNVSNATGNAQFSTIVTNKVKIKWYQVPKIVMTNRKYTNFAGQINYGINFDQKAVPPDPIADINLFNWPMWDFQPGTLLYLGMNVQPSTVGVYLEYPFSSANEATLFQPVMFNNYVDVTFEFLHRVIPSNLIIRPDLDLMSPNRGGKMYTTGWNFVPFSNGAYRYIESYNQETETTQMPPYFSFPIQILFDPQNENLPI
jgi:hypothetical protein